MTIGLKWFIGFSLAVSLYFWWKYYRYMSTREFKYFSFSEFDSPDQPGSGAQHMSADFIHKLDNIRECAGFPFLISSGYRTPEHNERVGGVANSSHLNGLAADISAPTTAMRDAIVECAAANGIKRIGYGNTFIHLDVDQDKPQYAIWGYSNSSAPNRVSVWPELA